MLFTKKKKNSMQIGDIYTHARWVPELLSACQIGPSSQVSRCAIASILLPIYITRCRLNSRV